MLEEVDNTLKAGREEASRYRREALSALLELLRPLAYLSYDHPKPCRFLPGSDHQLLVYQPVRARPWVRLALEALQSPRPPSGLSGEEGTDAAEEARWSAPVFLPKGELDTGEAIRRISREAGVNVGWDPRELSGALLRRISLPGGRASFREALGALARRAGFLRVIREPGAGAWLLGPREASSAARGRWESSFTLGVYPVADLDEAMGVETVLGILRSRLEGDPWREPGAVLAYHAGTKRILARQRPEIHLGIHAVLSLLRREGAKPFDMGKADAVHR